MRSAPLTCRHVGLVGNLPMVALPSHRALAGVLIARSEFPSLLPSNQPRTINAAANSIVSQPHSFCTFLIKMDFQMEIDTNSRKRGRRDLDFDDFDAPAAKKTRQFDADAPTRDARSAGNDTSYSSSPVSTPTTPASMDEDIDMLPTATTNWTAPAEPRPQGRGTIISGWNQARRTEAEMRQKFPWLYTN